MENCPYQSTCEDYLRAGEVLTAIKTTYKTVREISAELNYSVSTIERITKQLFELGFLRKSKKLIEGKGKSKFGLKTVHWAKTYKYRRIGDELPDM